MSRLLLGCLLTVTLETALFALFGFRDPVSLGIVACLNAVTNLGLNLALGLLGAAPWAIAVGEALVMAAEYVVCRLAFGPDRRLLPLTIAANVLSFSVGLMLF